MLAVATVAVIALVVTLLAQRPAPRRSTPRTQPAAGATFYWETGQRPRALVDLDEIRSGGPPPDGIPAIDHPRFIAAAEATWLRAREPVISLVRGGEARAYPLQILTWHEIVNDVVAGEPVTVTFCPLCNSAIAFSRRVRPTEDATRLLGTTADEAVLDFGTSGRLYRSNLVMYDRQTKSLWIQFTGQSVVGPFIGTRLEHVPVQIVSWAEARRAHPDVRVLSRDTGFERNYGRNPYVGYDDADQTPFLYDGPTDGRLRAMDRVLAIRHGEDAVAYPLQRLAKLAGRAGAAVVTGRIGDLDVVILYRTGTASALDQGEVAAGRDVGATGVFLPRTGGRTLTFAVRDGAIVDAETKSVWNLLGEAVSGPLRGSSLEPVVHDDTFWFVWAAFHPRTRIWAGT